MDIEIPEQVGRHCGGSKTPAARKLGEYVIRFVGECVVAKCIRVSPFPLHRGLLGRLLGARCSDPQLPPFTSKLGGVPCINRGSAWPRGADGRDLGFIAQVNCQDIPCRLEGFPGAGVLSFYAPSNVSGNMPLRPGPKSSFVQWIGEDSAVPGPAAGSVMSIPRWECALQFEVVRCVHPGAWMLPQELLDQCAVADAYSFREDCSAWLSAIDGPAEEEHTLGEALPFLSQQDMHILDLGTADEWVTLLKVNGANRIAGLTRPAPGILWWYLIRRQDFKAGRFEECILLPDLLQG